MCGANGRLALFVLVALAFLGLSNAQSPKPDTVYARAGKKPHYVAQPAEGYDCTPFGVCEPCPEDEVGSRSLRVNPLNR